MKITLRPLSHPELAPIDIDEALFAIGRSEQPFQSYDRNLTSRLSKRHAKLFVEGNRAYVADLRSTNGTRLNGAPVSETAAALHDGDRLEVGDLCYEVHVDAEPSRSLERGIQLILLPEAHGGSVAPVVITEFPYLVHRDSEMFANAAGAVVEQLDFVSKRHAHFYRSGDRVFLEDLGSTNGTYVNGDKLEEHAHAVEDRDRIVFGSDDFAYLATVRIDGTEVTDTQTRIIDRVTQADGTVFVESAASFIEIFRTGDPSAEAREAAGSGSQSAAPGREDAEPGRGGGEAPAERSAPAPASAAGNREPRPARAPSRPSGDGRGGAGTRAFWWLGLSALAVTAALGWWWLGPGPGAADLYRMLESQQYPRAASTANDMLDAGPFDPELARIATTATLNAVLPGWTAAYESLDRDGAAAAVGEAGRLGSNNPDDDPYLELLQWAVEVHALLGEQAAGQVPGNAFQADAASLLAWWQLDQDGKRARLDQIVGHVPGFEPTRRQILADVRTLMLRMQ